MDAEWTSEKFVILPQHYMSSEPRRSGIKIMENVMGGAYNTNGKIKTQNI
jgi:hypothetical protein